MIELKPEEILLTSIGKDVSNQLIFSYWKKEQLNKNQKPLVYCSVLLNKFSFWKRLKLGIQYIFGKQSKYGYFEEFIFIPEDGEKLCRIGNYLQNIPKANEISRKNKK